MKMFKLNKHKGLFLLAGNVASFVGTSIDEDNDDASFF